MTGGEPVRHRRAGRGVLAVVLLTTAAACTRSSPDDAGPSSSAGPAPRLSTATTSLVRRPGERDIVLSPPLGTVTPLAYVQHESITTLFLRDRFVRVRDDGTVLEETGFPTTAVSVTLAPGRNGTAAAVFTAKVGKQPARTQLMWVDEEVRTIHEADRMLALVGALDQGLVIRESPGDSMSVVNWTGRVAPIGLEAKAAVVIPRSPFVVITGDRGPMRAVNLTTAQDVPIAGIPDNATFTQAAAAPVASSIAVVVLVPAGTALSAQLWRITAGDGRVLARKAADLENDDVLAGFSDDGGWAYIGRGGDSIAVRLADGLQRNVPLGPDETPRGWSRRA